MANYGKNNGLINEEELNRVLSNTLRKSSPTSGTIVAAIIIALILMIISPLITFIVGYIVGIISGALLGNQIVAGFAIFGITIGVKDIPLIGGFLGWISGFLPRATSTKNNN